MLDERDIPAEDYLLPSLDDNKEKKMSSNSLSALSEGTSPDQMGDENDYDGSEFLLTENVGIVTPAKANIKKEEEEEKSPEILKEDVPVVMKEDVPVVPNPAKSAAIPPAKIAMQENDINEESQDGLPTNFDVLCGQSRICANHTGNRRFQIVLDMYAPRYQVASTKNEKMSLTKEIVGVIASSGGRFLKYKDGAWIEITDVTARDKVSHALRTKVKSWQRQKEEKSSSPSPKKRASTVAKRRSRGSRRSSTSSAVTSASDIRTVSFDGSTTSSTSIMDELLKTQREIFEKLTQSDGSAIETHPLKRTETW
jgi:hypothetical protein